MADHFSGPRAIAEPAADITDVHVFPSPERPGHLALVLNVLPLASANALFSDALTYRFRVRTVTIAGSAFAVGQDEYSFSFTFAAPVQRNGGETLVQMGTCTSQTGAQITFQVGDEQVTEAQGLRLFAGPRLDSFFFDLPSAAATEQMRRLAFKPQAPNAAEGQNVLSIVLEAEVATVFGATSGPLFAVVGETLTSGKHSLRIERMGRPEIKNVIIQGKEFDTVNRDLEIRDLYNAEDTFQLGDAYLGAYRARLNANLSFFDSLDDKIDWPLDAQGNHPLTDLLLADFLVVDVSKPYSEESSFEIESALLAKRAHTTCGGRSLNDDIIDRLYTLMVNGGNGPRIRDGVDQATKPATRSFPYLNRPNPNPPDALATVAVAVGGPPQETAR